MKWEHQIYSGLSAVIVLLFLLQSQLLRREEKSLSEVSRIESFHQLLITTECNIFLMKGEKQNILVEGPGGKMKNIETINQDGCIRIKGDRNKLVSRMLQFLKGSQDNINIYISLKNLDDIHIYSGKDKPDVKYSTHDMIGLTLKEGKTLILESKTVNSCDNLTS